MCDKTEENEDEKDIDPRAQDEGPVRLRPRRLAFCLDEAHAYLPECLWGMYGFRVRVVRVGREERTAIRRHFSFG